jgi:nitrous oxidase accessory protein
MMMNRARILLVLMVAVMAGPSPAAEALPSFQELVDATPDGGTLLPKPGVYAGPVVIGRPINIYGSADVIIDNAGTGTVMTLNASHSVISGLTLRNSGDHHTALDAALQVKSHFNTIKDLNIENCLFGIDLHQANNNIVKRNRIHSVEADIGLKGDAIRVWYSLYNTVSDNVVENVRDGILVWYSRQNEITGNTVVDSRYGLHFMYAEQNIADANTFRRNMVGIFAMYANGLAVKNNTILESNGPSGIGLGLKQTSDATLTDNTLIGNATGFYLDQSPEAEDIPNLIKGNSVAYNGVGMHFLSDQVGTTITGNDFIGNFTPVAVHTSSRSAARNTWDGNHWDTYQGFDANRDGVGDSPMELYDYADRLWMDVPPAGFFRGAPVLEMLDFIQRLAPFSQPALILRDAKPQLHRVAERPH